MFHIWSFVNVTWMLFCTISHAHKLLFWWILGKITIAAIIQQPVRTQKSGTVIMQHNSFPTRSVNTQLHLVDRPCMLAHKMLHISLLQSLTVASCSEFLRSKCWAIVFRNTCNRACLSMEASILLPVSFSRLQDCWRYIHIIHLISIKYSRG